MASSTYMTYLMYKATSSASTYTKLVDIKEYPDLGGAPEMLDVTTLSDGMRLNIPGIQDVQSLAFTANYDPDDYDTLKGLEGTEYDFAVWFGATGTGASATPDGSMGKFEFKGRLTVYPVGGGVNAVRDMSINIAASTVIDKRD